MKFTILNRKIHYWGSIIITIPLLVVIGSGILLLLKKDAKWIQPQTIEGSSGDIPEISFLQLVESASNVKEAGISSWEDIKRIDIQPGKGMAKVISNTNYEIQVDTGTGEILQVAYRRSDLIESLHDGTYFHDSVKYLVSLPSGIILFILLVSGVILFMQPYAVKAKRKRKTAARSA
jgi:uncharacterized iron-regulated membrane protein